MEILRFMAGHFRKPHGWFGSLVFGRFMNRVNRQITDATIDLLEIAPQHNVLEIGFGGGVGLARLTKMVTSGKVSGIDFSPEMVGQAERLFRRQIAEGRVQVQLGNVSAIPFPDATFERVLTINTIYFWPDALQGMGEIRRVLKNGGRAAVSIRSGEKMANYAVTKYDFRLFSPEDVAGLMGQTGFRDIRIDHRDRDKWYDQVVVIATR